MVIATMAQQLILNEHEMNREKKFSDLAVFVS